MKIVIAALLGLSLGVNVWVFKMKQTITLNEKKLEELTYLADFWERDAETSQNQWDNLARICSKQADELYKLEKKLKIKE